MWKEEGKKPIVEFLFWAFAISWGFIVLILLLEKMQVLSDNIEKVIAMLIIGFGAGMAPAYAVFIIMKKHGQIKGLKDFWKRIIVCENRNVASIVLLGLMGFQLLKCVLTEQSLGNPWYYYLLLLPLMIIGGGLEEIGWRGFFQTALEEKGGFWIATLIQGIVWAIWHIPLWFVENANQSSYNFVAFLLYCMAFSFSLALLYKVSKCVLYVIVLHAWGNVVLGGMFTYTSLTHIPKTETLILYVIEIVVAGFIAYIFDKKRAVKNIKETEKILVVNSLHNVNGEEIEQIFSDAEIINIWGNNISHCIGCNSCWIKTPGKCVIKDDYETIFQKILKADKVIFITEEHMGMVSYKLKNVIDRLISLDMPYTCIKNGQARHAQRYNKSWKFMIIVKESKELAYLNQWLERVAINFHSESLGVFLLSDKEGIHNAVYHS